MRAPRAFTLLELIIGTTISLAIAGVAMSMLLTTQATQRETQLKNAVTRDAMYVLDMIGADLAYAGVGVPFGNDVDGFAGRLRPVVRVGTAKTLVFTGDLPLPNADTNGMGVVVDMPPGASSALIGVVSDLSLCAPPAGGTYSCNNVTSSLAEMVSITSADTCSSSKMDARTCPWALGKWQKNNNDVQNIVITAPDGRWAQRAVPFGSSGPTPATVNALTGVSLKGGPISRDTFAQPRLGASLISTIDRVFYSLETLSGAACTDASASCVLLRRHCWGDAKDPSAAGFPFAGAPAVTSAQTPTGCTPPQAGTRWETVANNIERLTFRYFERDGSELTPPLTAAALATVAAVQAELVILRNIPGTERSLEHRMTRQWFLDGGDGFGDRGRH